MNVKNRTIFTGDNLHILRGLESESVDLIYLDPPFNSNRNYAAPIGSKAAGAAFKDTWSLSDLDVEWLGEVADVHPSLHKVIECAGMTAGNGSMSYLVMMGVRLLEMHRILKRTGSIYLHCDDVMDSELKIMMDAIFGHDNYRNKITWRRATIHSDGKRYGRIVDSILFYSKSNKFTWNKVYMPYSEEYIKRRFINEDAKGKYRTIRLTTSHDGHYTYEFAGYNIKWICTEEKMKKLVNENRIHYPKKENGIPERKQYLSESKGVPLQNIWTDIPYVGTSKERLGYPTQKPLALLERIIKSSTNEGDTVLDPFCGCATACSAAERLNRSWIGIDISSKAYEMVQERLYRESGMDKFTKGAGVIIHRTDIPKRAGQRSRDVKHTLYGRQAGDCNGCGHHFEYRHFEVDHIIPKAKGGQDDDSNLQLLCGSCNRIKGSNTMSYLRVRLKQIGVVA